MSSPATGDTLSTDASVSSDQARRRNWIAHIVVCCGVLMMVLDTMIATVALPSIVDNLHISDTALSWVLNAYLLTFGGFLVLGGRLGDLYGPRRVFLAAIVVFTVASLICGLAPVQGVLLAGRALQGLGGAGVTAVALALITSLFPNETDRARALGIYTLVGATGAGLGELLGGVVVKELGWNWVFLINLPIGVAVWALCARLLPPDRVATRREPLDIGGSLTLTGAMALANYVVANANVIGWSSAQTVGLTGVAVALFVAFVNIETRIQRPLIPFGIFRYRNFLTANIVGCLCAAGTYAWFAVATQFLQRVLHYGPLEVGFAFMPATAVTAIFSATMSARMVTRCGIRDPIWVGLLLMAAGLACFAAVPLGGMFATNVLPGMLLVGLGSGITGTPLLLAALKDVDATDSGIASGVINTAYMMGAALGIAVLTTVVDFRTDMLKRMGVSPLVALNGGYELAFEIGALLTAIAAIVGALVLRTESRAIRETSVPSS